LATIALFATKTAALTLLDQAPTGTSGVFSDESFDIYLSHGHSQSVAENFQVITNGDGFLLEEVVVWGGFEPFAGSSFPLWDDVDVLVHADHSGLPGTVLCSESGVVALRQATGSQVGGRDEYMVTLTLFSPCGLSDGSYWIEVYYNTGYGYDDWFWEFGTLDPLYGLPDAAYANENPGVTWAEMNVVPFNELAVALNGTLGSVTCVDTAAELQSALNAAGANGADDVIQVVQGIYLTPGSRFGYVTSESFDLQLLGGFNASCTDRAIVPADTILDGGGENPVLAIQPGSSTWGRILVQGFTIRNGAATGSATAGLEIAAAAGFAGRITIDHNMVLDNHAESGSAGLHSRTDGNLLAVINNLIAGNASSTGHGAGFLSCNGEATFLTNNTVADNSCPACVGGLEVTGAVAPQISNNILWGNDGVDLAFHHPATWLDHNDVGTFTGTPDPGSLGNLSVDPLFIGGGNYRLQIHSPVSNQGTNSPYSGLPAFDLDGRPRTMDGHVDMGAYEIPPIFISGFEDPQLGDWTLVVGRGGGFPHHQHGDH
jgi:hypothetical protein